MDVPFPPSAAAAVTWATRLFEDRDPAGAWQLVDPDLQLARIQGWLLTIGEVDGQQMAIDMASQGAEHPLWGQFEEFNATRWWRALGSMFAEPWGVFDQIEPVGIDLELVALTPTDREREIAPETALTAQLVVMRFRDTQWRVAGIGRFLAVPGWPPTEQEVRKPWS